MTSNLWSQNSPKDFWQCSPCIDADVWEEAIRQSLEILDINPLPKDVDELLEAVLGEGQFGPHHWSLSRMRRLYYDLKPFLPRPFTRALRRLLQKHHKQYIKLDWPIDARYPRFQFVVLGKALELAHQDSIRFRSFWPNGKRYAFVLTHDIESEGGQQFVRQVADLEEGLDFRSSFNFVPERYRLDIELVEELYRRGFEVGIHGLKHDGKLFRSRSEFERRAAHINRYLKEFNAVGFRAPLTQRHPEWMQVLDIEYDLSFFDTDPFEPIPGGTMSIWPFFIGHFVELPYTLVQDYTLTDVLQETTPRLWLEKVEFIRQNHGIALINTHPDYLKDPLRYSVYSEFLHIMRRKEDFLHALPREAACWWRDRASTEGAGKNHHLAQAVLEEGVLQVQDLSDNI